MPSSQEANFNRSVADILLPEYQRETGNALSLVACNKEFPDLVCIRVIGGNQVHIELVEIGLFFANQENDLLRHYESRFSEALSQYRPAYRDTLIRLQISSEVVATSRPHGFPHHRSREADLMVIEFQRLVGQHQGRLLPSSGWLLRDFATNAGKAEFPTLLRQFDAIIVNQIPQSYPGRPHPDDPVIDLRSVTLYSMTEISAAVAKAFRSKDKGPSYEADILVLHALQASHKPYFPGTAMHADEIVRAGKMHLPLLKERFNEVWFLNAYFDGQRRLYRLK